MELNIRPIRKNELQDLLDLYPHLNETDAPLPDEERVAKIWREILDDPKVTCLAAELDGRLIASCMLVIVPNLTRGARPYGLIENVVTHKEFRKQGVGTALLQKALAFAWERNCYKVMLLTSRKDEATLRFYEKAGFQKGIKTGFVAHLEPAPGPGQ